MTRVLNLCKLPKTVIFFSLSLFCWSWDRTHHHCQHHHRVIVLQIMQARHSAAHLDSHTFKMECFFFFYYFILWNCNTKLFVTCSRFVCYVNYANALNWVRTTVMSTKRSDGSQHTRTTMIWDWPLPMHKQWKKHRVCVRSRHHACMEAKLSHVWTTFMSRTCAMTVQRHTHSVT